MPQKITDPKKFTERVVISPTKEILEMVERSKNDHVEWMKQHVADYDITINQYILVLIMETLKRKGYDL